MTRTQLNTEGLSQLNNEIEHIAFLLAENDEMAPNALVCHLNTASQIDADVPLLQ